MAPPTDMLESAEAAGMNSIPCAHFCSDVNHSVSLQLLESHT